MKNTALISGANGQDGLLLASFLVKKGYKVIGLIRSEKSIDLKKIEYLSLKDKIDFIVVDLTNLETVKKVLKKYMPNEVYNLAAQSSVGMSFKDPINTIRFNTVSVLTLLEAIRVLEKPIKFYQASSSEMFGNCKELPIKINSKMNPVSPYGVSKKASFELVNHYANVYGIFAVNGILFNHESVLRDERFFIMKVIDSAYKVKSGILNQIRLGNLNVKRDFGYAPEYVKLMWKMLQQDVPKNYIICSGSSVLLRDVVYYILDKMNLPRTIVVEDMSKNRPQELFEIYGDNSLVKKELDWTYELTVFDVLDNLITEYPKVHGFV